MSIKVELLRVVEETPDVKSLFLSKPDSFTFVPGQYCMVSLAPTGEARPLTLTSIPSDPYLQLTVKKAGVITSELLELETGVLYIKGPFGEVLNFDENISKDVVFLAGGSGITPFMSAIRYHEHMHMSNRLYLLYANKTPDDIIFNHVLSESPNVEVHNIMSNSDQWKGHRGYIDKKLIKKTIPKGEKLWFICGPPPFNKTMKELVESIKGTGDNIRMEPWEI